MVVIEEDVGFGVDACRRKIVRYFGQNITLFPVTV